MTKFSSRMNGTQKATDSYDPGENYTLTSGFPTRPSGDLHDGIDFAAPAGTAVYSAARGQISAVNFAHKNNSATAQNPNGYGMLVDVLHTRENGSTFTIRYGHVQASGNINVGDMVEAGQQIGTIQSRQTLISQGGMLGMVCTTCVLAAIDTRLFT